MDSQRFIYDAEGQIREAFFIAEPKRIIQTLEGMHTILKAIGIFVENAPPGMRLYAVTEVGAKADLERWIESIDIPSQVQVIALDIAPTGGISGAEWARDHVLAKIISNQPTLAAPATDVTTVGMHEEGQNAFGLWLSNHLSLEYEDLTKVFLPGGEVISEKRSWITSRSRESTAQLESVSDQELVYFEYYLGDAEDEISNFLDQQTFFFREDDLVIKEEATAQAVRRKFLRPTFEELRSSISRNLGFVSFGLHVDNLLTLTGMLRNGRPLVLLAERQPVELSGFAKRQVLKSEKYLGGTATRLREQGFEVIRNPIPVARVDGIICDLCYNNSLVENSVRSGYTKPIVFLPGFGLDDLRFEAYDKANKEIWEQLGFEARLLGGWASLAPADGALRCAINVVSRGEQQRDEGLF